MLDAADKKPQDQEVLSDPLSGDDVLTAYLELALKIYLRIKNDGQTIHKPEFDDESDPLYDHTATRSTDAKTQ